MAGVILPTCAACHEAIQHQGLSCGACASSYHPPCFAQLAHCGNCGSGKEPVVFGTPDVRPDLRLFALAVLMVMAGLGITAARLRSMAGVCRFPVPRAPAIVPPVAPRAVVGPCSVVRGRNDLATVETEMAEKTVRDLAAGDLDGDGRSDLVVVVDPDRVRIYQGWPGYPHELLPLGDVPVQTTLSNLHRVVVADATGDGKPDLLLVYLNGVVVMANCTKASSRPVFQKVQEFSALTRAGVPAVADLDGDGRPEILLSGGAVATNSQHVYPGTVAGGPVGRLVSDGSVLMTPIDSDRSGRADLVFCSNTVELYRNRQNAGPRKVALNGTGRARDMACADLNGDGRPDIVTLDPGAPAVSVYLNQSDAGGARFWPAQVAQLQGVVAGRLYLGDLDGDGRTDVLVTDRRGGVAALLNRSDMAASALRFELNRWHGQKVQGLSEGGPPMAVLYCQEPYRTRVALFENYLYLLSIAQPQWR